MDEIAKKLCDEQMSRYARPVEETVEAGRVRDYLMALDRDPPADERAPVPPLFLLTLGRMRRPHLGRLPGGAVNAGDEFTFAGDVFVGDRITVETDIVGVEPRPSGSRAMYLISMRRRYRNQHGELVATRVNRILRWP